MTQSNLTLEQEFKVQAIKNELPKFSRESLEDYLIKVIIDYCVCRNICNQIMKKNLGIENTIEKTYSNILP
jgi:hypothetical protein